MHVECKWVYMAWYKGPFSKTLWKRYRHGWCILSEAYCMLLEQSPANSSSLPGKKTNPIWERHRFDKARGVFLTHISMTTLHVKPPTLWWGTKMLWSAQLQLRFCFIFFNLSFLTGAPVQSSETCNSKSTPFELGILFMQTCSANLPRTIFLTRPLAVQLQGTNTVQKWEETFVSFKHIGHP